MEILLLEKCIKWCAISTNGLTEVIYLKHIIKKTTVLQLQNKGTTVIQRDMDTWLLSLTFCTMHLAAVSHPINFQSALSVGGHCHHVTQARISVFISSGATLKNAHQSPHQCAQCWGEASENEATIEEISNYMLHDMGDKFVVYLHQVNWVSGSQAENVHVHACTHAHAHTHTHTLYQYKSQLLFKYEMFLLYTIKLWMYCTLKPFYVFLNSFSNFEVSEI
jgi:hypothetical protein